MLTGAKRYKHMRFRSLSVLVGLLITQRAVWGAPPPDPYINPAYFTSLPFGAHSYWLQPWRAYQETVPANEFLQGIGINIGGQVKNPHILMQMLAKYGFRSVRIEVGWVSLDYRTEQISSDTAATLRSWLLACQRYGLRPLILLNANQGAPCPMLFYDKVLAAPAHKGDTHILVTDAQGVVPGYSGLNNLTEYWAAEAIVTSIQGNTLLLSKPLPKDLGPAGTRVSMCTLKYRPFSPSGSEDDRQTLAGWQHYVGVVARFVAQTLGTEGKADLGFDMEIWNELSFGSNFLYINHYYSSPLYHYDENAVWGHIVKATAAYAQEHPDAFRGVTFCDGFSNTVPWPASSQEPPRVGALSKHPYAGRHTYPQDEQHGSLVNALFQQEPQGAFRPLFSVLFPEYYATALQTECMERDMGPIVNDIYGVAHGRYARTLNGKVVPCDVWITEVNIAPNEQGLKHRQQALALKAKTTARYLSFFLNKGVKRLYFYAALGGDLGLGLVQDNFVDYVNSHNKYPADDAPYVSPALQVVSRIVAKMRQGLNPSLLRTRNLQLLSWKGGENHPVFGGDGTAAHPSLTDHDLFAFLPYQVNSRRFVIPFYVMGWDVLKSLPAERFEVKIGGLHGIGAQVTVYDPIMNRTLPCQVRARTAGSLTLELPTVDYPRLLLVQEKR